MNKKIQLLLWMKNKKVFSTSEVIKKGMEIYSARADRSKREFLAMGLITKLPEWKKELYGYRCKDAVYEANIKAIEEYLQPSLMGGKNA